MEANADAPTTKRRRPPLSVDFSGYDPEAANVKDGAPPRREADKTDMLVSPTSYAMQAELAATAAAGQGRIEPLAVDAYNATLATTKSARRAQLQREAEAMRAALEAKQKELDDLEEFDKLR